MGSTTGYTGTMTMFSESTSIETSPLETSSETSSGGSTMEKTFGSTTETTSGTISEISTKSPTTSSSIPHQMLCTIPPFIFPPKSRLNRKG
ncbi:unnamed protein product [Caenorhabditis nigoni]